jgi:hypothetical protein
MKFLISLIFISNFCYGQINSDTIAAYAKEISHLPLCSVDIQSPKILKNFSTKSGWHIEHFGILANGYLGEDGKQRYRVLDIMTFVYNDSVKYHFFSSKWFNHNKIIYDSIKLFNETNKYLFIKVYDKSDSLNKTVYAIPKKQYEDYYEFQNLIYEDYKNNFVVEYNPVWCAQINKLKITNLEHRTILEIDYKRNKSFGGFNTWTINEINYVEGTCKIKATLKHKKRNKQKIDIKELKL